MRLIDDIFIAIYEATGIPKWELLKQNRKPKYADYRHIATSLIQEYNPELTYGELSILLNGRDPSTIRNSLKKVKHTLHFDYQLTLRYYQIIKQLRPMNQEEKIAELKAQQKALKERIDKMFNYLSPSFKEAQSQLIKVTDEIALLELPQKENKPFNADDLNTFIYGK
jgi:hypothetical protein